MNDKKKAEQLSRSLDAMFRGEDVAAEDLEEEIRELSALGRSLADVEFESGPIHKAAVERLIKKHRAKIRETVTTPKEINMVTPPTSSERTRSRWFVPVALSGALALLFACVVVAVVGGSLAWRALRGVEPATLQTPAAVAETEGQATSTSLPATVAVPTEVPASEPRYHVYVPSVSFPLAPQHAKLGDVQGVVRVQGDDGSWAVAAAGQILEAGQRVRTAALSSAQIVFYDGSVAYLEPETEVSMERLDEQDGSRIIEMTQWVGETDHDVAPAYGELARYQVHTPSGTGAAKGTFFHVSVTPALAVRFRVDEGAVEVTNVDVTVIVIAGQLTTIAPQQPPAEPVFQISGEGEVEQIGAVWQIAGQEFATGDDTVIVGNPLPGDWVRVVGHMDEDGTRVADRIVLLRRAPTNRFTITGQVEATGAMTWTVAGLSIGVDLETTIEEGIEINDLVRVDGVIQEDGTLLAESIRLVAERGLSFTFVGVVQGMTDTQWTISGISVTVDADTTIDDGLVVGDVVQVRGEVQEDGTRLAHSIARLVDQEYRFEFTGYVESKNPWIVSGVGFETDEWTEIEAGIVVSDLVKVEGRILVDGTWIAEEIKLADDDEDEDLSFEFVGTVEGIDPWIVSGIALSVTDETEIEAGIVVSDLVKVEGKILLDGTWLATKIKLVEETVGEGCVQFAALVLRVDPDLIVLQDGTTLSIGPETLVDGEIQANSVILFYLCVGPDGEISIVSIIVIYQLEPIIVIIPPAEPPPSGGTVTICHKPGTPAEKTMTIPTDALKGHLGHGDTLGACGK